MKFGLTEDQYHFIIDTVVRPLAEKGWAVWCFGSRAKGTQQKFSDLDLLVDGPGEIYLGSIEEQLIESNFPYKVDLVTYKNLAESYQEDVNRSKVLFLDDSK
ncbi:MAG: nucleotidyltransferase domain-containing protein [Bdellovibrionota bacterium]|nr:nucleotidyltransferase domain-containing protein [Deltaproteobacteria bacterium]